MPVLLQHIHCMMKLGHPNFIQNLSHWPFWMISSCPEMWYGVIENQKWDDRKCVLVITVYGDGLAPPTGTMMTTSEFCIHNGLVLEGNKASCYWPFVRGIHQSLELLRALKSKVLNCHLQIKYTPFNVWVRNLYKIEILRALRIKSLYTFLSEQDALWHIRWHPTGRIAMNNFICGFLSLTMTPLLSVNCNTINTYI